MFRSVAYKALSKGIDLEDDAALADMLASTEISFEYESGDPYPTNVLLDGQDVTSAIRTFEIDNAVTPVCQQPSVRSALLEMQRAICQRGNYVVDGRDIGSVVFPNAEVKVYLDASVKARSLRRQAQNKQRGVGTTDLAEVKRDIERRDYEDMHRNFAPLVRASDAVLVDSTDLAFDEVVDEICRLAR